MSIDPGSLCTYVCRPCGQVNRTTDVPICPVCEKKMKPASAR